MLPFPFHNISRFFTDVVNSPERPIGPSSVNTKHKENLPQPVIELLKCLENYAEYDILIASMGKDKSIREELMRFIDNAGDKLNNVSTKAMAVVLSLADKLDENFPGEGSLCNSIVDKCSEIGANDDADPIGTFCTLEKALRDSDIICIGEAHFKGNCDKYLMANFDFIVANKDRICIFLEGHPAGRVPKGTETSEVESALAAKGVALFGIERENKRNEIISGEFGKLFDEIEAASGDCKAASKQFTVVRGLLKEVERNYIGQLHADYKRSFEVVREFINNPPARIDFTAIQLRVLSDLSFGLQKLSLDSRLAENAHWADTIAKSLPSGSKAIVAVGRAHLYDLPGDDGLERELGRRLTHAVKVNSFALEHKNTNTALTIARGTDLETGMSSVNGVVEMSLMHLEPRMVKGQ